MTHARDNVNACIFYMIQILQYQWRIGQISNTGKKPYRAGGKFLPRQRCESAQSKTCPPAVTATVLATVDLPSPLAPVITTEPEFPRALVVADSTATREIIPPRSRKSRSVNKPACLLNGKGTGYTNIISA